MKWFRRAAEQGDADARYNLSLAYENGDGVAQDHVQALKWLMLVEGVAPFQVHPEFREKALERRNGLIAKMTPEQIAKADRSAREWAPK